MIFTMFVFTLLTPLALKGCSYCSKAEQHLSMRVAAADPRGRPRFLQFLL
jgi:hypothetical protein